VQVGPRRDVQLAVAVRGEKRIGTQLTQLTIPVDQGLQNSMVSSERVCRGNGDQRSSPDIHGKKAFDG
jgi:hypothetical protein